MSITIYKTKVSKILAVLSSLHNSCDVLENAKRVPETIDFYNQTKYGVDIFDSMTRKYTTKAGARRWPVHVFYNLLDISALNAYILHNARFGHKLQRRNFLLLLGEQLCSLAIKNNLPLQMSPSICGNKRKQCQITSHHNKTNTSCSKCKKLTCGPCSASKTVIIVCKNCI